MIVTLQTKDKAVLTGQLKGIKQRLLFLHQQAELNPSSLELMKINQDIINDLFRVHRELRLLFIRRSLESMYSIDDKPSVYYQPIIRDILKAML